MHDEVDSLGHQAVGHHRVEALVGHRRVHHQATEHALRRLCVNGAHRPVVALAHGQEHGQHLLAADLADAYPLRVHAQPRAHEVGHGELADAFDVGRSGLQGHDVRVKIPEAIQAQLEAVLDGDDALVLVDLVHEATHDRGLAGARPARNDHVARGLDGTAEEVLQAVVDHPQLA